MTWLRRRDLIAAFAALVATTPAFAAPVPYALARSKTLIAFTFQLSGTPQTGTMPIRTADVWVDTRRLQNSRATVVLDAARAETRLPFAREPMLSPQVLDAARFPTIRFRSTRIRLGRGARISDGATITGDLTLRGITRPIVLQAALYRPPGSARDELDRLSIQLTGALNRHDFGASGYADLVGPTVGLDIRAEIERKT